MVHCTGCNDNQIEIREMNLSYFKKIHLAFSSTTFLLNPNSELYSCESNPYPRNLLRREKIQIIWCTLHIVQPLKQDSGYKQHMLIGLPVDIEPSQDKPLTSPRDVKSRPDKLKREGACAQRRSMDTSRRSLQGGYIMCTQNRKRGVKILGIIA
jgi:hypothetical protein